MITINALHELVIGLQRRNFDVGMDFSEFSRALTAVRGFNSSEYYMITAPLDEAVLTVEANLNGQQICKSYETLEEQRHVVALLGRMDGLHSPRMW